MEALRDMLEEFNPYWKDEFPSIREAAEYYGLEAMLEYYELPDETYEELNFHEG